MTSLARARARLRRGESESGFALIYVLAVTTMVGLLVSATLVVTTGAVVPAVHSAYDQAADAAAQSGLQDFVTKIDSWCGPDNDPATQSVEGCTLQTNVFGPVNISISNSDGSYTATYKWEAKKDPGNQYFRVWSKGVVKEGGVSAAKIVLGDVVAGNSLDDLNYGVVTGFETQSSSTILADWPERTIALDPAAIDAADFPIKGGKIHWSGSSPGTAAGKVAVCNAKFDDKGGRGNNPPPNSPNPYVDYTESGLNGNNYSNYQPCHTSWGHGTELLAPADQDAAEPGGYYSLDSLLLSNSYPGGTGPLFNQPVQTGWQYSTDDATTCGTAQGQNYRSFTLICGGLHWNVEVGGAPNPNSTYPSVQYREEGPLLPDGVNYGAIPDAHTCVYAGPTRIVFNGDGTAVVTSPQTTSTFVATSTSPGQCYVGAGVQGMAAQTVNLTGINLVRAKDKGNVPNTTPAIAHGSTGWPTTGQRLGDTASTSNSVFYLTAGTAGSSTGAPSYAVTANPGSYVPAVGDNPSTKSDGAWNPQWPSYTNNGSCGASTPVNDLKFFNCYVPTGSYGDAYSWLKAQVQAAIAANPSNYTTSAALQSLVNSFVSQGNSSDASSTPAYTDYRSHRWVVSAGSTTVGSCTASTGQPGGTSDTPIDPPSDDPFYQGTPGNIHTADSVDTSCVNVKVGLQIGTCNVALVGGICVNLGNYVWGNGTALLGGGQSVAQLQLTFTVKKTTRTTTTTPATSTFPSMSDVTQYQMGFDNTGNGNTNTFGANGPGDLYVEGEVGHTMALVGDDDLVVTGDIGPAGTNPASPSDTQDNRDPDCGGSTGRTCPNTPALELVGRNTVRIYHPVQCANAFNVAASTFTSEIANTDPGFCPNDITGLYNSLLPDNARPSAQYANMRPGLAGLTIHAALFALGNSPSHINCPQPPNGGGVCGGEFTVDNFSRGAALGYLTEIGTLGMAHHSPVGEEWEIADTNGATGRLYSGYQLAQQYEDLKSRLHGGGLDPLLGTSTPTSGLWHIVSISTGTPS